MPAAWLVTQTFVLSGWVVFRSPAFATAAAIRLRRDHTGGDYRHLAGPAPPTGRAPAGD